LTRRAKQLHNGTIANIIRPAPENPVRDFGLRGVFQRIWFQFGKFIVSHPSEQRSLGNSGRFLQQRRSRTYARKRVNILLSQSLWLSWWNAMERRLVKWRDVYEQSEWPATGQLVQ
jgi:hypothetical protein